MTVTNRHPMRGPVTTILCDRCATFDDDGFAIGPDGAGWCWFPAVVLAAERARDLTYAATAHG